MNRLPLLRGTLPLAVALLAAGCSYYHSHTITYLGAPRPAPTEPARVEILHRPPERPHDRLGEIVVDASLSPPPDARKLEERFRREAARLGADAVFIVHDRAETTGWWVSGPWWGATVSPTRSRLLVGVAIKYQQPSPAAAP